MDPDAGICSNCDSLSLCEEVRPARGAIWFCEGHSVSPRAAVRVDAGRPRGEQGPALSLWDTRALGLRATCEARDGCGLTGSSGAVQHCEEYR